MRVNTMTNSPSCPTMKANNLAIVVLLLVSLTSLDTSASGDDEQIDCNGDSLGNSTIDRQGCLDSDGDGYSDVSSNWTRSDGADVFPADPMAWSDLDNDGFTDQRGTDYTDDCPFTWGLSRVILNGCSDIDRDFVPDAYDDDADGDGIRNELERRASNGTVLFDPFNGESTPLDTDLDTIPDVLDEDNDNDDWPDEIEIDRGSDPFDENSNPLNMYFGINTGFFYMGGLKTTMEYNPSGFEMSLSVVLDVVTEELMIPFLLIPLYIILTIGRRRQFRIFEEKIKEAKSRIELLEIESTINSLIKNRGIKLYHGLVLRNTIEEYESIIKERTEEKDFNKNWDKETSTEEE